MYVDGSHAEPVAAHRGRADARAGFCHLPVLRWRSFVLRHLDDGRIAPVIWLQRSTICPIVQLKRAEARAGGATCAHHHSQPRRSQRRKFRPRKRSAAAPSGRSVSCTAYPARCRSSRSFTSASGATPAGSGCGCPPSPMPALRGRGSRRPSPDPVGRGRRPRCARRCSTALAALVRGAHAHDDQPRLVPPDAKLQPSTAKIRALSSLSPTPRRCTRSQGTAVMPDGMLFSSGPSTVRSARLRRARGSRRSLAAHGLHPNCGRRAPGRRTARPPAPRRGSSHPRRG